MKPGVFPETIIVKRRNANGETERHEYVPKKAPTIIHVEGFDDELPEADKLSYAIAFVKNAPTADDDDIYAFEIALFVLNAYLAALPKKETVDG